MYRPLGDKVVVKRIPAKKETASGIILRHTEDPDRGVVQFIGPDVTEVQIDEQVLVNWNAARKVEDETYVVPVTEIIWIFEE